MIWRREEPMTTNMKKPSMTGPTAKPYLDFSFARMSTMPRLWMLPWNLLEAALVTRLEAAWTRRTSRAGVFVSFRQLSCGRYREGKGARIGLLVRRMMDGGEKRKEKKQACVWVV